MFKRMIDDIKKNQDYPGKHREFFRRIECADFFKLAIACGKQILRQDDEGISRQDAEFKVQKSVEKKRANVLLGIGERDLSDESSVSSQGIPRKVVNLPYLLLDVRTKEEFLECHFKTARHYPSGMMSRTNACEIRELKQYRNVEDKIIILYDNDEYTAAKAANLLVQKNYNNVFLLCGGLKYASGNFPADLMASATIGRNTENLALAVLASAGAVFIDNPTEYFTVEDILLFLIIDFILLFKSLL
ncbi:centrosomal protein of 41 kDa A [Trichonephila inaurata madagascariensis]|uniref:Centrosomal protein of 41 kDa A n=1 Tax=Trichonephila inaurata madagascariensis TaxID=2747483 RepID=A0A8X7CHB5_9ARAC|nr:centrosomal protein of 41 kDa A [Trichonephila inaurata madagascariensis]